MYDIINNMKYPKEIKCYVCGLKRLIDYRSLWLIKKGKITSRCFLCSRPKKGEVNSGSFLKGHKVSDITKINMSVAGKGKKKPPRTKEHKLNLSKSLKGKNTGSNNSMARLDVRIKVSEAQRGEKSHNWKGGKRKITLILRDCFKYRIWRKEIFIRDNYTCVICKKRGGVIQADHFPIQMALVIDKLIQEQGLDDIIKKALKYGPLWDINNGRTLCKLCHKKTETYGKNIPRKQTNKSNIAVFV